MNFNKEAPNGEQNDLWSSIRSIKRNIRGGSKTDNDFRSAVSSTSSDSKRFSTKSGCSTKFDSNDERQTDMFTSSSHCSEGRGSVKEENDKTSLKKHSLKVKNIREDCATGHNLTNVSEDNFQMPFCNLPSDRLVVPENLPTLESYEISYDYNSEELGYSKSYQEPICEYKKKRDVELEEYQDKGQRSDANLKSLLIRTRKESVQRIQELQDKQIVEVENLKKFYLGELKNMERRNAISLKEKEEEIEILNELLSKQDENYLNSHELCEAKNNQLMDKYESLILELKSDFQQELYKIQEQYQSHINQLIKEKEDLVKALSDRQNEEACKTEGKGMHPKEKDLCSKAIEQRLPLRESTNMRVNTEDSIYNKSLENLLERINEFVDENSLTTEITPCNRKEIYQKVYSYHGDDENKRERDFAKMREYSKKKNPSIQECKKVEDQKYQTSNSKNFSRELYQSFDSGDIAETVKFNQSEDISVEEESAAWKPFSINNLNENIKLNLRTNIK